MMEQNNNQAEQYAIQERIAAPQKVDTERWKTDGK